MGTGNLLAVSEETLETIIRGLRDTVVELRIATETLNETVKNTVPIRLVLFMFLILSGAIGIIKLADWSAKDLLPTLLHGTSNVSGQ